MKASDIHAHFVSEGTWVNWSHTTDGFHFGDPEAEVTRIAVGWKPYWRTLREAHEMGCDFFLSHESIFRDGGNGDETEAASDYEQEKLVWLQESGMVVMGHGDLLGRLGHGNRARTGGVYDIKRTDRGGV